MEINEDLLDQLESLKLKRIEDINYNGIEFHIQGGTEATIKGLFDQEKSTVTFTATTPVHSGIIINSTKTGNLYIAELERKAGITVASVLPVLREIETMTQTKTGAWTVSGSVMIVGFNPDSIAVPAHKTLPTGSVLRHNGQLLSVTSVRRDGAVTHLRLAPLPEPQKAPGLKYSKPPEFRQTPTTDFWFFK